MTKTVWCDIQNPKRESEFAVKINIAEWAGDKSSANPVIATTSSVTETFLTFC